MTDLPTNSPRQTPIDPTAAVEHFFAGAVSAGLAHVVLSPGSRSTALSIAATRTPNLTYSVELDERVAAFVALGYAASTGRPVGLVCTSGTAAANYLPAVAEASLSNVPLVIITADRPPEHQHWGVGQSFDQRGLYNRQVRDEITMPVGGEGGARFCVHAGSRSVVTAIDERGPVHVNWPFRLPIEPTAPPIAAPSTPRTAPRAAACSTSDIDDLALLVTNASAPLIIAGPHSIRHGSHPAAASELLTAATALGIPVLADALSGLRGPLPGSECRVDAPALVVTAPAVPAPDLIIRMGHTPTAKAQRLWWEQHDVAHVLIDPFGEWQDPSHMATARFTSPAAQLLSAVESSIGEDSSNSTNGANSSWLGQWQALGRSVAGALDETLLAWPTTTEAHIARALLVAATSVDRIVAASSMPIRDIDTFGPLDSAAVVLSNRGINGIDGVVSTAIGAELASSDGRTYALVGDVAALHDVGGLLSAGRNEVDLTVIVPNNDGGGIFSLLPIRDALNDADFNELFHTPHGTTFNFLDGHPGITVLQTTDVRNALIQTRNQPGLVVIEVVVDTPERMALADAIRRAIGALQQ